MPCKANASCTIDAGPIAKYLGETAGAQVVELRAMAEKVGGEDRTLVELKAVDAAYPLVGSVDLEPGLPLARVIAGRGTAVEPALASRLALKVGFTISEMLCPLGPMLIIPP